MKQAATTSLRRIEDRMEELDTQSLRYQVLNCAKQFKTSWIELGRALYTVWHDKLYKEWGYSNFDNYTAKEIGIRKQTAMKLLRSYYFLEKEEPLLLKEEGMKNAVVAPSLDSVEVLRQAKNKKLLNEDDYNQIKKAIFEEGKEANTVKKDLTALIRQRQELEPEEAWEKRRLSTVRRFLGTLKALTQEMQINKILSASLIREAEKLIKKLEEEVA